MSLGKRILGVFLLVIGLVALLTPLTPGSWLAIVGLQLLGFGAIVRRGETRKAGVVIVSQDQPRRMVLLRQASDHSWGFPEGRVGKEESLEEAARRGVAEETGLTVELARRLPDVVYRHQYARERVRVAMFLAHHHGSDLIPPESTVMALAWVPQEEVRGRLTHQNAKEFYDHIVPLVKETV